jgi:hypothetical protein
VARGLHSGSWVVTGVGRASGWRRWFTRAAGSCARAAGSCARAAGSCAGAGGAALARTCERFLAELAQARPPLRFPVRAWLVVSRLVGRGLPGHPAAGRVVGPVAVPGAHAPTAPTAGLTDCRSAKITSRCRAEKRGWQVVRTSCCLARPLGARTSASTPVLVGRTILVLVTA